MQVELKLLGNPVGYKEVEMEKVPQPGREISLHAFQREPIRFYVMEVTYGNRPMVLLKINEGGVSRQEVFERCSFYSTIPVAKSLT